MRDLRQGAKQIPPTSYSLLATPQIKSLIIVDNFWITLAFYTYVRIFGVPPVRFIRNPHHTCVIVSIN